MHYGAIKYCDIANGTGVRTSLFVSGCTHRCKGCFQPETWSFSHGDEFTDEVAADVLASLDPGYVSGLAVLGGEPMEPANQQVLAPFLQQVKATYPQKTIWLYTGDTFEDLRNEDSPRHTAVTEGMLACLDVMVDGRFVEEKKDITLRFRGSSNQRIIDVPASLAAGEVVLWQDDEVYATHDME
jgi:anaerobic ribonucleoside-triphosphate reductase activating protein